MRRLLSSRRQSALDSSWAESPIDTVRSKYAEAIRDFRDRGYIVTEIPIEKECRHIADDPRKGKNMWGLGMLCALYDLEVETVRARIAKRFAKKGEQVIKKNNDLLLTTGLGFTFGAKAAK